MKPSFLPFTALTRCTAMAAVLGMLLPAFAQERIYRCGNEYTNDASVAKTRGCKVMEGGNITIVQGTSTQGNPNASTAPTAPRNGSRNDSPEQRARDSDARRILEAELRKAEDRLAQAQRAYANGQPEKEGTESRNHQRYLDRVAELKAALNRAETDVNSLKRELARMGAPSPAGPVTSARPPEASAAGESAAK
jgi:hypothetical protein